MDAHAMVDAALKGLDLGVVVAIPPLPDTEDWNTFEAARKTLLPGLRGAMSATRYR